MCMEVRGQPRVQDITFYYFVQDMESFAPTTDSMLAGLGAFRDSISAFCLMVVVLESHIHTCYPARLFIGSGDLNLGPHACVTSALPIEISLFCFYF